MVRGTTWAAAGVTALLAFAPAARAVEYVWAGSATGAWSDAANWTVGGTPAPSAPTSGADTALWFPNSTGGANDLAGLSVGTLRIGPAAFNTAGFVGPIAGFTGTTVTVTGRVDLSTLTGPTYGPVVLAGPSVVVRGTTAPPPPFDDNLIGTGVVGLTGSGSLLVEGRVALYDGWAGPITTAPGSTLAMFDPTFGGPSAAPRPTALTVNGRLESSRVRLAPGGVADLRGGVVDTTNDFPSALPSSYPGSVTIEGDARLGAWFNDGANTFFGAPAPDGLSVTGTLDLTDATLYAGLSWEMRSYAGDVLPAHVTLATYGNRVGAFNAGTSASIFVRDHPTPSTTVILANGLFPIVYTSGENAGPGEVRIALPEPGALLACVGVAGFGLRRHVR